MVQKISDKTKAEASRVATEAAIKMVTDSLVKSAPASEEEIALVREYLDCLRKENQLKATKKAIQSLIGESMLGRRLKALTYQDLPIVAISATTQTTRDWDGLMEDYPEIAINYTTSAPITRMDFKKNVLPGT